MVQGVADRIKYACGGAGYTKTALNAMGGINIPQSLYEPNTGSEQKSIGQERRALLSQGKPCGASTQKATRLTMDITGMRGDGRQGNGVAHGGGKGRKESAKRDAAESQRCKGRSRKYAPPWS